MKINKKRPGSAHLWKKLQNCYNMTQEQITIVECDTSKETLFETQILTFQTTQTHQKFLFFLMRFVCETYRYQRICPNACQQLQFDIKLGWFDYQINISIRHIWSTGVEDSVQTHDPEEWNRESWNPWGNLVSAHLDQDSNHDQVNKTCPKTSVTRLGNLLDFGQLFKAFGNN